MDYVKSFWETCKGNMAHLKFNWEVTGMRKRLLDDEIFSKINFRKKRVIDHGCGGGYITKYLIDDYRIARSICIDIAERSIYIARKILRGYKNVEYHLMPVNFADFDADIFLSISVIQHFPDEGYLAEFLDNLNNSKIPTLALTIKYYRKNKFNDAYKSENNDKCLACMTNHTYMQGRLTNYKLRYSSKPQEKSQYQFLIYELLEDIRVEV